MGLSFSGTGAWRPGLALDAVDEPPVDLERVDVPGSAPTPA